MNRSVPRDSLSLSVRYTFRVNPSSSRSGPFSAPGIEFHFNLIHEAEIQVKGKKENALEKRMEKKFFLENSPLSLIQHLKILNVSQRFFQCLHRFIDPFVR